MSAVKKLRQHASNNLDDNVSKPAYDSHTEGSDDGYDDDEFEREPGTDEDVTPIGKQDVINIAVKANELQTAISARGHSNSNNLISTRSYPNIAPSSQLGSEQNMRVGTTLENQRMQKRVRNSDVYTAPGKLPKLLTLSSSVHLQSLKSNQ